MGDGCLLSSPNYFRGYLVSWIGRVRRSRPGRKTLALVNAAGCHATALFFWLRRKPIVVDGNKFRFSAKRGPSISFFLELLSRKYEQGTRRLVESKLTNGMTVVDVGAHAGYYALLFARCVGSNGKVYAFEPEPDNYALLKDNIALNGYTNIEAIPKAVSNRSGTLDLFVSSQGNDRHSIFANPNTAVQEQVRQVPTVSLDDLLASKNWPRVDLVKMDVEGAEILVLEGMSETIRHSPGLRVLAEFAPEAMRWGGREPIDLLTCLNKLGFAVHSIADEGDLKSCSPSDFADLAREAEQKGMVNLYCERKVSSEPAELADSAHSRTVR